MTGILVNRTEMYPYIYTVFEKYSSLFGSGSQENFNQSIEGSTSATLSNSTAWPGQILASLTSTSSNVTTCP